MEIQGIDNDVPVLPEDSDPRSAYINLEREILLYRLVGAGDGDVQKNANDLIGSSAVSFSLIVEHGFDVSDDYLRGWEVPGEFSPMKNQIIDFVQRFRAEFGIVVDPERMVKLLYLWSIGFFDMDVGEVEKIDKNGFRALGVLLSLSFSRRYVVYKFCKLLGPLKLQDSSAMVKLAA